jgi:prolyl-tRNA synthetase
VKFKDAELIGVPTIVTVGRGVADPDNQVVEVKDRRTGERREVALAGAAAEIAGTVNAVNLVNAVNAVNV